MVSHKTWKKFETIPVICWKSNLPKLKEIFIKKRLMTSILCLINKYLIFLSGYAAASFITAISCFFPLLKIKTITSLIILFSLLCWTYAHGEKDERSYWVSIPCLCLPVYIFVKYLQPQNYLFIRTIHFSFKIAIR